MDVIVAAPTTETPVILAGPRKFTAENAREMSMRAAEARKFKAQAEKARVLAIEAENALAKPLLEIASLAVGAPSVNYVMQRLSRVRAQLEKIDALIDAETDPQKLDRLVCAQNRLSEQWRIFSGIPLPGSRRPGREKPTRGGPTGGSLMADE